MPRQARPPVLRCDKCRQDKATCLPRDRPWPGEKCDRCNRYQYNCGPSVPPPIRPVRVPDQVSVSSTESQQVLKCMYMLSQIAWDNIGLAEPPIQAVSDRITTILPEHIARAPQDDLSPLDDLPPVWLMAVNYMKGQCGRSNMVLHRLWERQHYSKAQGRFDEIYRAKLPRASILEAKRLAIEEYTQEIVDKQIRHGSEITSRTHVEEAVFHILRRGSRWSALAQALNSVEILLLDQNVLAPSNDRSVGDVTEWGTNEEFEELKSTLVAPRHQLKEVCWRLTGVSGMLGDTAHLPRNSQLRDYLVQCITSRIGDVFRTPAPTNVDDQVHLPTGVPQCFIVDIFGIMLKFPGIADTGNTELQEWEAVMRALTPGANEVAASTELEAQLDPGNVGPTPPSAYTGLFVAEYQERFM